MSAEVFVDTNVLVYARDAGEPEKSPRAREWLDRLWRTGRGRLGFQVLAEYYVTVTAKLEPGLPPPEAREDVRDLLAWQPVGVDGGVLEEAFALFDRYGLSWWDALIAGAARVASCGYLLSEDFQDGQDLGGVVVVDPFAHPPDEILGGESADRP
jgi:predicted nucleic acid-binding protein